MSSLYKFEIFLSNVNKSILSIKYVCAWEKKNVKLKYVMMHIFFFALLKFNQKQYFRKIKTIINEKIKQKNMDYNSFSEFDEVYFNYFRK